MGSGLGDALTDAFRNGTDAAEEFGKTADEILENMIQQIAYNAVFSKMFDQAQEEMETKYGSFMKSVISMEMEDGEPYLAK